MSPSIEPFNEVKYKALMDGLECSERMRSCLERTDRIDAEFYRKENLYIEAELKKTNFHPITDYFAVSDGNHMSISDNFCTEGIPYYRGQDIYNVFIEEATPICIDTSTFNHPHMKRSHLKHGDVLMSIVGAIIGNSAIVSSDAKATCSCKLAILRSRNNGIVPEFLLTYINSKYGQNQIQKYKRGAAQTGLLLEDFDQIFIPVLCDSFQKLVQKAVFLSHNLLTTASQLYSEAEKHLAECIGYKSFGQTHLSVSIKSCIESFLSTSRLDAEYYQPKFDEYYSTISNLTIGHSTVAEEFTHINDTCDRSLMQYKYVEIGDVNVNTAFAMPNTIAVEELPDNAKIMTRKNDLIISTVRPNRGAIAILEEDNLLVSGAFTVLRERGSYKKEVLQVLLRLPLYRDWLLRYNVGTSYPVIKDSDVLNMPIPLFDDKTQNAIAQKVQAASVLRKQSKLMLEYAKQAIELAIEQSEDAALEWLNDKLPEKVE